MAAIDRKVYSGGLAGLVTWGITATLGRAGIQLPPEIQGVIPVLVGFGISWVVPPAAQDIISHMTDALVAAAAADPKIPVDPTTAPQPKA